VTPNDLSAISNYLRANTARRSLTSKPSIIPSSSNP